MPQVNYIRHQKSKRVTLISQITTTELKLTTSVLGSAINVSGYKEMAVVTNVIHNSTNAPEIMMQVSPDGGTTWGNKITLDADLTTTANKTYVGVTNFGDTIRVFAGPASMTTTSQASFTVKAVLKT